jgi:hypothetical protein
MITDNPWGSHQPLLFKVLEKYGSTPLLELGCGDFSTPYMAKAGLLDIYSTDPIWASKYEKIATVNHLTTWDGFRVKEDKLYTVTLLDSEELVVNRLKQIPYLLTISKIVIMHDWRASLPVQECKYQGIYTERVPWTWWGSNVYEVARNTCLECKRSIGAA